MTTIAFHLFHFSIRGSETAVFDYTHFNSLLLSNNKFIKKLNKNFRNKNKSTDVLSFPLNKEIKISKKTYIGDIIISYNFMNKPKSQNIKNLNSILL